MANPSSISGLENCHIIRPGYGIEYDLSYLLSLNCLWKCKQFPVSFAGQLMEIRYEEGRSGILAELCWTLCSNKPAIILQRDEALRSYGR